MYLWTKHGLETKEDQVLQCYQAFQMYSAAVIVTNNTGICLNGSKFNTDMITHFSANGDNCRESRGTETQSQ